MTETQEKLLQDRDIAQLQSAMKKNRAFVAKATDYSDKALVHVLNAQEVLASIRMQRMQRAQSEDVIHG